MTATRTSITSPATSGFGRTFGVSGSVYDGSSHYLLELARYPPSTLSGRACESSADWAGRATRRPPACVSAAAVPQYQGVLWPPSRSPVDWYISWVADGVRLSPRRARGLARRRDGHHSRHCCRTDRIEPSRPPISATDTPKAEIARPLGVESSQIGSPARLSDCRAAERRCWSGPGAGVRPGTSRSGQTRMSRVRPSVSTEPRSNRRRRARAVGSTLRSPVAPASPCRGGRTGRPAARAACCRG